MTTLLPENLPQFSPTVGHYHMARGVLVSMFMYGKSHGHFTQPTWRIRRFLHSERRARPILDLMVLHPMFFVKFFLYFYKLDSLVKNGCCKSTGKSTSTLTEVASVWPYLRQVNIITSGFHCPVITYCSESLVILGFFWSFLRGATLPLPLQGYWQPISVFKLNRNYSSREDSEDESSWVSWCSSSLYFWARRYILGPSESSQREWDRRRQA